MMAAHNAERYIGDALASLLRQRDDANLDIIVVNDGSTDGTAEIVRRIAAEAPEVRLIETPNQGIARTRNRLLDAVAPDTDLVTILDSDDLSPAGRFSRDARLFEADPALEFHYGATGMFRGTSKNPLEPDRDGLFITVRGIQLGAALLRWSLAERVGKFDDTYEQAEDTDYLFRLLEAQPRLQVVDDVCVYYRRHDTNITRDIAVSKRDFTRALISSIRRRKQGSGGPIPPKFFDGRERVAEIDWW